MRSGDPIPDRIQNAPTLAPGLYLYYLAFQELSTCRSAGFGVGPIPWMAIDRWAVAAELDMEQREDLFYFVHRMDQAYIDWSTKK